MSTATTSAESPVADAAEKQAPELVQRLLLEGADPNAPQIDGMTALHWAVLQGEKRSFTRLLIADADPNAKTRYGVTPLSIACELGRPAIVRRLLLAGADANLTLPGKVTPLMLATQTGDKKTIDHLLHAGAKVNAAERKGQTALMWAASAGSGRVIDRLIAAGADIEKQTWVGLNALMFAAREGRLAAVERLVAAGADVNAVTGGERRGGERGPRPRTSALIMAVESAHYEVALRLVRAGADPNDQRSGYGPLHVLSWARRPELGDNERGDPPPRGSGAVPPLRFVREFVAAGADVNLRLTSGKIRPAAFNPKGATPFILAAKTADVALMQTLLEAGSDPLARTDDGTTALITAAGLGVVAVGEHPGSVEDVAETARLLVELGVDVNAVNENNQTAMHGAAYRNYPETVTLLAELGADPAVWNIKNHHGSTPVQIAQGKRPGSLKPSPETVAALRAAMDTGRRVVRRDPSQPPTGVAAGVE